VKSYGLKTKSSYVNNFTGKTKCSFQGVNLPLSFISGPDIWNHAWSDNHDLDPVLTTIHVSKKLATMEQYQWIALKYNTAKK